MHMLQSIFAIQLCLNAFAIWGLCWCNFAGALPLCLLLFPFMLVCVSGLVLFCRCSATALPLLMLVSLHGSSQSCQARMGSSLLSGFGSHFWRPLIRCNIVSIHTASLPLCMFCLCLLVALDRRSAATALPLLYACACHRHRCGSGSRL